MALVTTNSFFVTTSKALVTTSVALVPSSCLTELLVLAFNMFRGLLQYDAV